MTTLVLERKTERIEARVTPAEKSAIETAASMLGETIRDFVISSAKEKAMRTMREREVLTLTERSRQVFLDALLNPPQPNAAALAAAQRYLQEKA